MLSNFVKYFKTIICTSWPWWILQYSLTAWFTLEGYVSNNSKFNILASFSLWPKNKNKNTEYNEVSHFTSNGKMHHFHLELGNIWVMIGTMCMDFQRYLPIMLSCTNEITVKLQSYNIFQELKLLYNFPNIWKLSYWIVLVISSHRLHTWHI